jgi:hypothetical protein
VWEKIVWKADFPSESVLCLVDPCPLNNYNRMQKKVHKLYGYVSDLNRVIYNIFLLPQMLADGVEFYRGFLRHYKTNFCSKLSRPQCEGEGIVGR